MNVTARSMNVTARSDERFDDRLFRAIAAGILAGLMVFVLIAQAPARCAEQPPNDQQIAKEQPNADEHQDADEQSKSDAGDAADEGKAGDEGKAEAPEGAPEDAPDDAADAFDDADDRDEVAAGENAAGENKPRENEPGEEAPGLPNGNADADAANDPKSVADDVRNILAQPEFRRLRLPPTSKAPPPPEYRMPEWVINLFEWIRSWFPSIPGIDGGAALSVLQIVVWTILFLLGVLIAYLIYRSTWFQSWMLKMTAAEADPFAIEDRDLPPGELEADVYVKRAAELAARGQITEAIAQLLLGAMSHTERSGLIRFRRGLTHRDYIRALRSKPTAYSSFRGIVGIFEPLRYGHRSASLHHYSESLAAYESGFAHAAE